MEEGLDKHGLGSVGWSRECRVEVRPEVRQGLKCQGKDPGHYLQGRGATEGGAWEGLG